MNRSNKNILKVLEYVRKLLFLADKGDLQRKDDGCGVLYGIVRDSAYKMKDVAEKEIDTHRKLGKWDEQVESEDKISSVIQ